MDIPAKTSIEKRTGRAKRREKNLKNEPANVTMDDIPESIKVMDFFEARAKEFSSMMTAVGKKGGSKRTFQKLPRHMRRRATSHNIKRLPRRLRERAENELENEDSKSENKKQSRRKRRKPSNLRSEYERRQHDKKWLETHIWHAKRMKMINKWSYRLAKHCSDKGVRANYRFMKRGAIISDISYYSCIELSGKRSIILNLLQPMFDDKTGVTPSSNDFFNGTREGISMIYHPHSYPYRPIGPVWFLWKPRLEVDELEKSMKDEETKLWLWVHPSIFQEVFEVLGCVRKELIVPVEEERNGKTLIDSVAISKPQISITDLREDLLRFRLVGPKSHLVLMTVLHLMEFRNENETMQEKVEKIVDKTVAVFQRKEDHVVVERFDEQELKQNGNGEDVLKSDIPEGELYLKKCSKWNEVSQTSEQRKWWKSDDATRIHSKLLFNHFEIIQSAESSSSFPHGSVLAMTVRDPRLYTPVKRKDTACPPKVMKTTVDLMQLLADEEVEDDVDKETEETREQRNESPLTLPPSLSYSPLWELSIREAVSLSKIPDHIINSVRSHFFLKPSQLELGDETSHVPVLLVQKTYSQKSTKGRPSFLHITGWDIILPRNWGMAFWIALIYHGARACGLKELKTCFNLECLSPVFPDEFPDTSAGRLSEEEERISLEEKYLRYPPDKRPNFGKLRIQTPYHPSWSELISKKKEERKRQLDDPGDRVAKKAKVDSNEPVKSRGDEEEIETEKKENLSGTPYLLRCQKDLVSLYNFIACLFSKSRRKKSNRTNIIYNELFLRFGIDSLVTRHQNALVTLQLEISSQGIIMSHSTISLPTSEDLINLKSDKTFSGPVEIISPRGLTIVEKGNLYIGEYHIKRKEMKVITKERKKLMKLKKREIDGEEKLDHTTSGIMCNPMEAYSLKSIQSCRQVIGYVQTTAGYRHTSSRYSAIAHSTLIGLVNLCKSCYLGGLNVPVALVRGHSLQYRMVSVQLITYIYN